jgi:hypothetical protein
VCGTPKIQIMLGANAVVECRPEVALYSHFVVAEQRNFDMQELAVAPVSEACSLGAFEGCPVAFRYGPVEAGDVAG